MQHGIVAIPYLSRVKGLVPLNERDVDLVQGRCHIERVRSISGLFDLLVVLRLGYILDNRNDISV
jgi:hypothetical protein